MVTAQEFHPASMEPHSGLRDREGKVPDSEAKVANWVGGAMVALLVLLGGWGLLSVLDAAKKKVAADSKRDSTQAAVAEAH